MLTHWGGDNYTLQLNDSTRGYIDNLSIKITREAGETPGTYVITPDWADDAVQNYNVTFVDGKLRICIARVSNDDGATWTYHQWLENDSDYYPESSYDNATDDPSEQGAFDKARAIGGDVIVETLCKNDAFAENNIDDRYVLGKQIKLNDGSLTSLIFRTTEDADFTSVISRGYDGNSLFASSCAFTLENIVLDGSKSTHTGDNGGLVYIQQGGALTVSKDATLRNFKVSDKGGAVYVEGTLTVVEDALITGNSASGKANAVYVNDGCSLTMTGGSITGNNNTDGYAIEIGGANAVLSFSGRAVIYDNVVDVDQHNVYLNYDEVGIINSAGLTASDSTSGSKDAKIGVYVEDTAAASSAEDGKLFADRGGVLDRFGTYSDPSNLSAFVNDRNGLKGAARGDDEIIWVQTVTVEVRYIRNLLDYATLPTAADSIYKLDPSKYVVLTEIEYVPSMGKSKLAYDPATLDLQTTGFTIGEIVQDIYENYGGKAGSWATAATDTMVFWRGYAGNEGTFSAYVEALLSNPAGITSEYGKWAFDKNNESSDSDNAIPIDSNKLVLYYTEPAFITIRSDCGHDMTAGIDMKVMLAGYKRTDGDKTAYYAPSDTDPATVSAFDLAFVTKTGETEKPKPYGFVTAEDLSLANKGSVTLMIPGAVGAMYWISGGFDGVVKDVTVISVDRNGRTPASDEKTITLNTGSVAKYASSTTPQLPLSQANAYEYRLYGGLTEETKLHFGEAYICKITDATGNLLRVDGDIQAFKSIEDGFKAYKDNELNAYT